MDELSIILGSGGIIGSQLAAKLAKNNIEVLEFGLKEGSTSNFTSIDFLENSSSKVVCDEVLKHVTQTKFDNIRIFCNAGGAIVDIEDYLKEDWDIDFESEWLRIVNGNIAALFIAANLVKKISSHIVQGNVLATSSVYGHFSPDFRIYQNSEYKSRPMTSSSAYTAGKAGVSGLIKYYAVKFSNLNYRFNSIALGGIESGQSQNFINAYKSRVPLGRMANVSEVIEAILALSSPNMSYLTGQTVIYDGGMSAW